MNRALPDFLHSLAGNSTETTVLERPRARFEQDDHFDMSRQQQPFFDGDEFNFLLSQGFESCFAVKPDPGWPDLGGFGSGGFGVGSGFEGEKRDSVLGERLKKRKADKDHKFEAVIEKEYKEKKMKACSEERDSKITEQNSDNENKKHTKNKKKKENSADGSKTSEVQKLDYIHVRARRGQATDSHSLAERVRREKISERMKYLQDLVPGCNKITGKAGMLDEIINYVQSLQKQVEFLSMKLAAVNPTLDFNIENLFAKEVFSACSPNFPIGVCSEITNPAFVQFNPLEQLVSCSGFDMGLNTSDIALRRTISAPVSIPETFLDSSTIFNQIQSSSNWDALQSLNYGMEFVQGRRSTSFPHNQFAGPGEASNLKMEMM